MQLVLNNLLTFLQLADVTSLLCVFVGLLCVILLFGGVRK